MSKEGRSTISVSSLGSEMERLKQAGFPYNFIATQLHKVGQEILLVSQDFAAMDKSIKELENKLDKQTMETTAKLSQAERQIVEQIGIKTDEIIFRKIVLTSVSAVTFVLAAGAGAGYLIDKNRIDIIAPAAGILALVGLLLLCLFIYFGKSNK